MIVTSEEIWLTGKPICRGIAIGPAFFFQQEEDAIPEYTIGRHEQIELEVKRYYRALERGKKRSCTCRSVCSWKRSMMEQLS